MLDPWKDQIPPQVFGPAWQPPSYKGSAEKRRNFLKAEKLLTEAGWVVKDGRRVNARTGKPFTFEILLSAAEHEKIALSFKNALRQMGIEAGIRLLDSAAFTERINAYDYDMVLYFWLSTLSPGTEQILYWGCRAAQENARWNYAGICNPAVDAISASIALTRDRDGLVARVRALDRILTWGNYMVPLYYSGVDNVASRKGFRHPQTMPLYGTVLETWWYEPPKP